MGVSSDHIFPGTFGLGNAGLWKAVLINAWHQRLMKLLQKSAWCLGKV